MKALVIYDSIFGNTEKIAQAIGDAIGSELEVSVLRVTHAEAAQLAGVDFLIVGSPTRAFRPTPAITNFLKGIANHGLKGIKVAAFDTRISMADVKSRILPPLVKLFGYAADPIANKLKKKGGELVIPPEGFFVQDSEGPLKEGEAERAAAWAKQIIV